MLEAFRVELGKHLLVETTAVMGPSVGMGDMQEAIHVNRLLRLNPPGAEGGERWELEADPQHVKSIPPTTENWLRKLYIYSMNNNTSTEDKHETNHINNKYNDTNTDTRKMHNL